MGTCTMTGRVASSHCRNPPFLAGLAGLGSIPWHTKGCIEGRHLLSYRYKAVNKDHRCSAAQMAPPTALQNGQCSDALRKDKAARQSMWRSNTRLGLQPCQGSGLRAGRCRSTVRSIREPRAEPLIQQVGPTVSVVSWVVPVSLMCFVYTLKLCKALGLMHDLSLHCSAVFNVCPGNRNR